MDVPGTLPAVTGPDPSAAPRVCPECGQDPRAGSPRTPWWCRRAGLPMCISLAAALLIAVLSTSYGVVRTAPSGSFSTSALPSIQDSTIEDIRSSLSGQTTRADRLIEHVLHSGSPEEFPGAALVAETYSPASGGTFIGPAIGWPLPWARVIGFDVDGPLRHLDWPRLSESKWQLQSGRAGLAIFWPVVGTQRVILTLDLAAMGLTLAFIGLVVRAALRVTRRWRRRGLRLAAAAACFAIAGVLSLRSPVNGRDFSWAPQNSYSAVTPFRRADVRQLAATPGGRREFLRGLERCLQGQPSDVVSLRWRTDNVSVEEGVWGWPLFWGRATFLTPAEPLPAGASPAPGQSFGWESGEPYWVTRRETGRQRSVVIVPSALAASLLPCAVLYLMPGSVGRMLGRRRTARYVAEGRCYSCRYDVSSLLAAGTTDGTGGGG